MLATLAETDVREEVASLQFPLSVLIIEDEVQAAEELAEALVELGHTSFIASCAQSAWRMLASHPEISTIISDFYLRGYGVSANNGIKLVEELRSAFPERNLDVIIISGDQDLLADCTLQGPLKFLAKPLVPESVAAMLAGGAVDGEMHHDPQLRIAELQRLIERQSNAINSLTASIKTYQHTAVRISDRLRRISTTAVIATNRLQTQTGGNVTHLTRYIADQISATQQLTRKPTTLEDSPPSAD